jgi:hypothetical protein
MGRRRAVGFYKDERGRTRPITARSGRRIRIRVRPTTYRRKGKLIHRKGYVYEREDVGAPGKGPKVIPPLKEGELSKHLPEKYKDVPFFDAPAKARRLAYKRSIEEDGYKVTVSRLTAIQVLNKRTNPEIARKAARDRAWIVKTFGKGD